jgi:hypothetical protein
MQTVKHKIFGIGEVIARESNENGTYITVRFENGKEMRFAIPDSFVIGIMEAEGSLKDEVEAAIAEKEARDRARLDKLIAASATTSIPTPSRRHGRKPATRVAAKSSIETAFEKYLIDAGYSEYSDAGNPSTVYSYTRAVKKVLKEEGISWHTLQSDIDNIIPIYDIGGIKQHMGEDSNDTVIDSLKRFREFVNA